MVTWVLTTAPTFPNQGDPHARYTILRPAVARPVRSRLLASDLPTLPRADRGGDPDHRSPHGLQPPPHAPGIGPRRSLQLSPRLLETALGWALAIYTVLAMRRVFRRSWVGTLFKAVLLFFIYSIVFALTVGGVFVYAVLQL